MEKEVGFEHLHVHTDWSLLDGYAQVEEYAIRIPQINMQHLAVTDHGMMGVIPRQIRACSAVGIKPIFGIEAYVNNMHMSKEELVKANLTDEEKVEFGKNYHLLALAYNNTGYSNLVQLSSKAWLQFYKKQRVTYSQIDEHKEGIIFTSSCYIGEIGQAFDRYGPDKAQDVLDRYIKWFGPNFYLEIMLIDFKKQREYNKWIVKQHLRTNVDIIVSQDCLVENTVVLTSDGSKFIKDVKVGDKVLTHRNRYKKVQIVGKRKLRKNDNVYRVRCSVGTYTYEATDNHKVRVANLSKEGIWSFNWKRTDELSNEDFQLISKVNPNEMFAENPLNKIDLLDFLNEDDYQIGSHVVNKGVNGGNLAAKLQYLPEDDVFVSYRGFDRKYKTTIPRYLNVDDDLLKVIGWYIAEGWSEDGKLQVGFALNENELDVADFIIKYFSKFGIIAKIYRVSENGIAVRFSSKVFNRFFSKLCGKGANNKHFPVIKGTWLKTWSKEQVVKFIGTFRQGDSNGIVSFASTSKVLIFETTLVFNALGICSYPSVEVGRKETWADCWRVAYCGDRAKLILDWFSGNEGHLQGLNSNFWHDLGECYAIRIESIEKIDYHGFVYDMQIEDDHSFLANLSQVSNCHYCRKEDSQQQRRMLMIRGKKTEKDFANLEDGQDYFELQDTNLWLKSESELDEKYWKREVDGFSYQDIIPFEIYLQAKRNTVEVARRAAGVEFDRSLKLPQIPDADAKFKEAVMSGFKWRGIGAKNKYINRLAEEVNLICKKGFSSYFLIQQEIVLEARRICPQLLGWGKGDEATGPGRGSAVGSLVCYCMGITDVDPLKHDLLFSRFLSEARGGREMRTRFTNIPIPDEIFDEELDVA